MGHWPTESTGGAGDCDSWLGPGLISPAEPEREGRTEGLWVADADHVPGPPGPGQVGRVTLKVLIQSSGRGGPQLADPHPLCPSPLSQGPTVIVLQSRNDEVSGRMVVKMIY